MLAHKNKKKVENVSVLVMTRAMYNVRNMEMRGVESGEQLGWSESKNV